MEKTEQTKDLEAYSRLYVPSEGDRKRTPIYVQVYEEHVKS